MTPNSAKAERAVWKRPRVLVAAGIVLLLVAAAAAVFALGGSEPVRAHDGSTTRAIRDKMVVKVTESGEVDAKESKDVKCLVEGQSTVLWVIEDGSLVHEGDKLVELDPTDVLDQLTQRQSAWRSAKAAYEQAERQYEIQQSTNESVLSDASLTIKFALLDLKKYVGSELAQRLAAAGGTIDFAPLADDPALGGEALQQKRKFQSDIYLAEQEESSAQSTYEWTEKLEKMGYVTATELESDRLDVERRTAEVDQARMALELFLEYDFPKTAEQRYTDWLEAKREYGRVNERAESELGSALSLREDKRDAFEQEDRLLAKAKEQVERADIHAPQDGMVVYDTGGRRDDFTLEAGASVRHQQTLIKLPNLSEMVVKAKLHESVVKQVAEGAPAFVTIDAYPDKRLTGRVTKLAVMPDRGNWWLNPGLKTYTTEITLDQTLPGLKPGMNAQVEVYVAQLSDTLQVPVAAVHVDQGYQVVYVRSQGGAEARIVEVGHMNDQAAEILEGIEEGEEVYLYRPDGAPALDVAEKRPEKALPQAPAPESRREAEASGTPTPDDAPDEADRERMKALREQFEQASPEERANMMKQFQERAARRPRPQGPPGDAAAPRGDGTP